MQAANANVHLVNGIATNMHRNQIPCRLHTLTETLFRRGTSEPLSVCHWPKSAWVSITQDGNLMGRVMEERFSLVSVDHVALLVERDMLPFFLVSMHVTQRAWSYRDVAYNDLLFSSL